MTAKIVPVTLRRAGLSGTGEVPDRGRRATLAAALCLARLTIVRADRPVLTIVPGRYGESLTVSVGPDGWADRPETRKDVGPGVSLNRQ